MSVLVNVLCRGANQPGKNKDGGLAGRFARWLGRRLALRHANVRLAADAVISPGALLDPRGGVIDIGARSAISTGAIIQGGVRLGADCSVQNYTMLVGYGNADSPDGLIWIGDGVRIAAHGMMIAGNHRFDDPDRPIRQQGIKAAPIRIEDDVWIGGRVNIMAGVTIGRGSVIGAGSVVTKDIPPGSVAVGIPARVVKRRFAADAGAGVEGELQS